MGLRTWIYKATGIKLKNFNDNNVQRNNSTTPFDNTQQVNAPATSSINAINKYPSESPPPYSR